MRQLGQGSELRLAVDQGDALEQQFGFLARLLGGVGVAGIVLGGNYLDYSVLADDALTGQHLGITLIEFGVGLTVASAMITIFYVFAGQDRGPESPEQ